TASSGATNATKGDEYDECDKSRPIGTSSSTLKGTEPPMARPNNASYPPGPETPGHSRAWESSTVKRCPDRPEGRKIDLSGSKRTLGRQNWSRSVDFIYRFKHSVIVSWCSAEKGKGKRGRTSFLR